MGEILSPGVYIQETSFRAKSIEGVATSTTGFVGPCRFGPLEGRPRLVTSFEEFSRYFGGLDHLILGGRVINHMAFAARAFFDEGGTRLYVARVHALPAPPPGPGPVPTGIAQQTAAALASTQFRARFPGVAGNVRVSVQGFRSADLMRNGTPQGLRRGDMVEITDMALPGATLPRRDVHAIGDPPVAAPVTGRVAWAVLDPYGNVSLATWDPAASATVPVVPTATEAVQRVTITVQVRVSTDRTDMYTDLSTHPDSARFIGRILRTEDPANGIDPPQDRSAWVWLAPTDPAAFQESNAVDLLRAFLASGGGPFGGASWEHTLDGGLDGIVPDGDVYRGGGQGDSARGLAALEEQDDIAIVAAPGSSADSAIGQEVRNALIGHCERLQYRFAVLASRPYLDTNGVLDERGKHDSTYAALYHPWVTVPNPFPTGGNVLDLSPEGFIAGIYARSDIQRGVHKAPANETVRGAMRFSQPINQRQQDVLNPEGVNCLRFFEGRGHRVWGARTISSDPEWQYVNVRRLFIYLEHSIDNSTQWAVFEPNNHVLWLKLRKTIESFLYDVWRTGALMGRAPEEAFFVRCDETTMSQGDLDNGRVICLIGVAPTKPAEFVIFRIGQWTADASII